MRWARSCALSARLSHHWTETSRQPPCFSHPRYAPPSPLLSSPPGLLTRTAPNPGELRIPGARASPPPPHPPLRPRPRMPPDTRHFPLPPPPSLPPSAPTDPRSWTSRRPCGRPLPYPLLRSAAAAYALPSSSGVVTDDVDGPRYRRGLSLCVNSPSRSRTWSWMPSTR